MPTLAGFAARVTFAENAVNAAPALLDDDVAFTAPGSGFDAGRLVVGGLLAEDRIAILAEGDAAGQIGVAGSTVSFGGLAIGSFAGGLGGTFTVTFNAAATAEAVDRLIERLAYSNASDTPTAMRGLTLDVIDGAGASLSRPRFSDLVFSTLIFPPLDVRAGTAPGFIDLDGDGDLDLVSGQIDGSLVAWRNTGTDGVAYFTPLNAADNPFSGITQQNWTRPTFGDLDGDGDLDLVLGDGFGFLTVRINNGPGTRPTFSAIDAFADHETADAGRFASPALADLDGDGDLDLFSGNIDGQLLFWRNEGTAAAPFFVAVNGLDNPFPGISVFDLSAPAFIDLDRDGDLDLVMGSFGSRMGVWRNTGTPTAPAFIELTGTDDPFGNLVTGWAPAFADLDGDGDLDILFGSDNGSLHVWFNGLVPSIGVLVTAENDAPVVTSGGTASVAENATGIACQATATDADGTTGVTWSLSGADAALFTIDANGAVRFRAAPDFEAPADAGGDNTYDVVIGAFDGAATGTRAVAIAVTDVVQPPRRGSAGPELLTAQIPSEAASLLGLGANDTLRGGEANDRLDGGPGADSMAGGLGDDTYILDNPGDAVVELPGGGDDRVIASVSWTLGAELERLSLAGTADLTGMGNALANRLDGNAGANGLDGGEGPDSLLGLGGSDTLHGGEGNDRLDGGPGADSMAGGLGDDTYVVDNPGDAVVDLPGGGHDRVIASIGWTLVAELERLSLAGTADLTGMGNALANRLDGNAGANSLDGGVGHDSLLGLDGDDTMLGGEGNDLLDGGLGADSLVGGAGADRLLFRSAAEADGDVVADFSAAQGDRIDLRPIDANAALPGDQPFAWIGGTVFGGVTGQLRFADGMLQGDAGGDGVADFQIGLPGVASLTAASFWL